MKKILFILLCSLTACKKTANPGTTTGVIAVVNSDTSPKDIYINSAPAIYNFTGDIYRDTVPPGTYTIRITQTQADTATNTPAGYSEYDTVLVKLNSTYILYF